MYYNQSIANSVAVQSQPGNFSDVQLKSYIDQVMLRYDTNRNGTLEPHEIARFFNELFAMCGVPRKIGQWEAAGFMRQVDTNYDGKANKFELFRAFKSMMNTGGSRGGYQSDWDPSFSGYVPAQGVYNTGYGGYGMGGMGGMASMGGYGGFGGYGGGYRMW